MASFNLVDRPFLPCLNRQGHVERLSLLEVLARSHHLVRISCDSPLQTAAAYRLLLAVLTAILDVRSPDAWATLYRAGVFSMDAISAYLARWRRRFDLFDPNWPFYQTTALEQFFGPVQKLFPERAAGNNDTLFDHTHEKSGFTVDPAAAALGLLAQQSFAVGGLVSFDHKEHRSSQGAPVAAGLMVLINGNTLWETLLLNLTRYDPEREEPFPAQNGDRPAWEREHQARPEDRIPDGLRDLLTFQARRLQLGYRETESGEVLVDRVAMLKGCQLDPGWAQRYGEPYVAFRLNEDSPNLRDRWLPIRLTSNKAVWRASGALFSPQREERRKGMTVTRRPYHFEWLSHLRKKGLLISKVLPVMAFGQATDQATILLWREERLLLPPVFLINASYTNLLQRSLALAESIGGSLTQCVRSAMQALGANTTKQTPHLEQTRLTYWAKLEQPFQEFLLTLAELRTDEEGDFQDAEVPAITAWAKTVETAARAAFQDLSGGLSTTARALAAVSPAEQSLENLIRQQTQQYLPQPQEAIAP